MTRLHSINKILSFTDQQDNINIANASFIPYYRSRCLIEKDKKRLNFVRGEYQKADYIYNNYVYEVDPLFNNKYDIPENFKKIYQLKINGVNMYEIWKKK